MNNKKLLALIILSIFCVGIMMGNVSAKYSFYEGGHTVVLSNKEYKQIKNHKVHYLYKNTGDYKKVKIPKYKTKKVTKYKWKYKKVKAWKYDNVWGDYKSYKLPSKYRSWKYVGDNTKTSSNGQYSYGYHIFKKKVKYTSTKKVKTGYKKVKLPIVAKIGLSGGSNNEWAILYSVGDYSKYHYWKSLGWYYFEYP